MVLFHLPFIIKTKDTSTSYYTHATMVNIADRGNASERTSPQLYPVAVAEASAGFVDDE